MKYKLDEIFDLTALQNIMDKLYMTTGIPFSLVDLEGNVLVGSGWQPLCMSFHRTHPDIERECIKSDTTILEKIQKGEKHAMYECPMGLVDCATPVYLENEYIANIFTGQFFFSEPNKKKFLEQAKKYGFNEDEYMKSLEMVPVIDKGSAIKYLDFFLDFSEFLGKKGVEQLKITETQSSLLKSKHCIESAAIGIMWLNANGDIIYANRKMSELMEYSNEELTQAKIFDLDRNYKESSWDSLMQSLKPDLSYSFETQYLTKNGNPLEMEVFSNLLELQDGRIIFVFLQDITNKKMLELQQKKAEDDTMRSQKIESISMLAGGIAHDYNNILSAILGNINYLQMNDDYDEDTKETLTAIETATIRASELTKQLLTFSKGGSPIKKPQSIEAIIEESVNLISRGANITFLKMFQKNLPNVLIDSSQLIQVFNNLLLNAKQAMPDGGTITLITELLSKTEEINQALEKEQYVKITIKDQGSGIPDKYQSKIFHPYFSTKPEGNGLGLATCYSIIKRHNGVISFESSPFKGTKFFIYLPITKRKQAEEKEIVPEKKIKFAGRVLIMDDEISILTTHKKLLEPLGLTLTVVENGIDAILEFRKSIENKTPYDLVILDLTIPGGMGGKEVMKALKAYDKNVKAVVSTGYYSDPVVANYRRYGFMDILQKPFRYEDLKNLLLRLLESQEINE